MAGCNPDMGDSRGGERNVRFHAAHQWLSGSQSAQWLIIGSHFEQAECSSSADSSLQRIMAEPKLSLTAADVEGAADEPATKKQKTDGDQEEKGKGSDEEKEADTELHYPEGDSEIWKSQTWANPDGTKEDIIEVEEEPRHHINFVNSHTKIITIRFPPKDVTQAHRHEKDTIIVILMKDGIDFINDVLGVGPQKGHMTFGQVGFAPFTKSPCVHKITNLSDEDMFCINVEVHDTPPLVSDKELTLPNHSLLMTQYNCRVYSFKLDAGESTAVSYPFFYVRVIVKGSKIKVGQNKGEGLTWEETHEVGESLWKEPCENVTVTNTGGEPYEAYICEFR